MPSASRVKPEDQRRRWIFAALLLLLGVLVFLPALRAEFIIDDYLHASMVDGTFPARRGPLDLYDFINDADRQVLAERGMLPWWSHPRLKIRFFRPLSSGLRWADQKLFDRSPVWPHLHSMLWWGVAVVAARSLFRRLLPPRPAWVATFIFALAPCHALPLAWLANREALVSLGLGTLALGAYLRWREALQFRHAVLAALLFALSMSAGEYALCLGGYIVALEVLSRGEGLGRRAAGLLPFALPAAAYLSVRAALGYGTEGSGFYTDPFREPAAFLASAPRRLVTLLAEAWFGLDHETLPPTTAWWLLALIAAGAVVVCAIPVRRAIEAAPEAARRHASWMLLGSALALLPVLAVVPSPRVLGASMLGVSVAVALLLEHAWFTAAPPPRERAAELTGWAALALGFSHLLHGPGVAWLTGRSYQQSSMKFISDAREMGARFNGADHDHLIVIRALGASFILPFGLRQDGAPPKRFRILGQTGHVLARRLDARAMELIASRDQSIFPTGSGNLFRDESAKMRAGETYSVPGLKVTILEMGEAGPRAVRYELDRDMDAPSIFWITETSRAFVEEVPPAVGFGHPFDP